MTARERLLRTIRGEWVDRIPICPPIPLNPLDEPERLPEWQRADSFQSIAALARQHCDCFVGAAIPGGLFDRRFLLIPPEHIRTVAREVDDRTTTVRYEVTTPAGLLTTTEVSHRDVATGWYPEPLVKDAQDAERILSVPARFDRPIITPYFRQREVLGERGLLEVAVSTPLVCVSRLLEFGQFLLWCRTQRRLIRRLVETAYERIAIRLQYLLDQGVDAVYWFGGSEQATPPLLGPDLYDDLVVRYDRPLIRMVRRAGCLAHVHSHGRVGSVLEKIIAMGAHMLDPIEPPPDGDITIQDAKCQAAGRITLMGNIEFRDLEFATPDTIERQVRAALLSEPRSHFILYPSARPITWISERFRANAIRYIEAGLEYGRVAK